MKSLVQNLSPQKLVSELLMKLSNPQNRRKVVVWVEGKDWRVYNKFFDLDKIIQYGKCGGKVIKEAHQLFKEKVTSVNSIVILDADFRRLEKYDLKTDSNIFYTDGHDVEMMMIMQENVRNGICEVFEYEGERQQFYDDIFQELCYLSYFKWFDYHHKRCYKYKPLGKVHQSQAQLNDLTWIENTLYQCSKKAWDESNHNTMFVRIKPEDVKEFIRENNSVNRYEITNGHDFYKRMCKHIKDKTKYERNEECLNDSIIALFNNEQFKKTDLHKSLRAWCDVNIDILRNK
ncbi:MAG: DUF4435 domain-containing protein [Bacteroidales bacterium]|nr:DUF4435 domain-containing protein [Bacteroidales bacterium]